MKQGEQMRANQKKYLNALIAITLSVAGLESLNAHAHGVTLVKAAELSLHRVERLVILNKLDAGFQTLIKGLSVVELAHQTEEDPSFKTVITQYAGNDGTAKSVEIVLDEEGRP